jgi:hypothetical protein
MPQAPAPRRLGPKPPVTMSPALETGMHRPHQDPVGERGVAELERPEQVRVAHQT